MKTPTCTRLARQLATWTAMYRHLTSRDLKRIRATHYCPECDGAWTVPPHLSREPEDE